jgi:molybdenum cofactor cytidylyltransferase
LEDRFVKQGAGAPLAGAWSEAGIGAVLLAAGRAARMGAGSKLLLAHPADGLPLVRHAALGLLALRPVETVVVLRPDLPELAEALAGLPLRVVYNPDYATGMASSMRAGVAALSPIAQAALIALGDTPHVGPDVFAALLAAYVAARRPVTIPTYGGVPGPPTLFGRAAFGALAGLTGDEGGRSLIAEHPEWVTRVPLPFADLPLDIDTPEDYQAYLAREAPGG